MFLNKVIIIGGNHHNTLGLVRSVGERNIKPDVFVHGESNYILKGSKYINTLQNVSLDSLVDTLIISYKDEDLKPIILSASDESISVLDNHYTEIEKHFYCFNANNSNGRINEYMNKDKMRELAVACGLSCPKTVVAYSLIDVPKDFPYPCVTKPTNSLGKSKADIHFCDNEKELSIYLNGNPQIVQPKIEKDFEILIPGLSVHHGEEVFMPGVVRKIRQYPKNIGCSAYSVYEPVSQFYGLDLSPIRRLVKEIGYEGLFSIEMMKEKDKYYFLEINMRNDGVGYVPTYAGTNLPYAWCCYNLGIPFEIHNTEKKIYFMIDTADYLNIIKGNVGLFDWLKDLRRTNCFLLYNSKDMKPFWEEKKQLLKIVLKKLHLWK